LTMDSGPFHDVVPSAASAAEKGGSGFAVQPRPLLTFYRLYCHHCVFRVRPFPALAVGVGAFPRHRMTTPLGASDPGGRLPPIWSAATLPTGREALASTLNAPSRTPGLSSTLREMKMSPSAVQFAGVVGCWALPMTWSLVLPMTEERTLWVPWWWYSTYSSLMRFRDAHDSRDVIHGICRHLISILMGRNLPPGRRR